jgi:hypothetical protein
LSQYSTAPAVRNSSAPYQHRLAVPPYAGPAAAALPVNPQQNRTASLTVVGGSKTASTAGTAVLNGTGLRPRP